MELPEGAVPLAVGTVLALVGLSLVLSPLLGGESDASAPPSRPPRRSTGGDESEAVASAVAALREIEFDRETGKLSDADYADLKARYTRVAVEAMRAAAPGATGEVAAGSGGTAAAALSVDDAVEAAIRRAREAQRACRTCGVRPEPDAVYCSECGSYLPGVCGRCGTVVDQPGARFCVACGEGLAGNSTLQTGDRRLQTGDPRPSPLTGPHASSG